MTVQSVETAPEFEIEQRAPRIDISAQINPDHPEEYITYLLERSRDMGDDALSEQYEEALILKALAKQVKPSI